MIMKENFVEIAAFIFQNACFNFNPCALQAANALTGNQRVGIGGADDDTCNFMIDNQVCAGRCFAVMATRFQSYIKVEPATFSVEF